MEHDERGEEMERDAEEMEERSERVGEHIEEARDEWEAKEADPAVPGAQPEPGEDDEETEPMAETPEQSDQLPEEGPPETVPDDSTGRPEPDDSPGVPGEEETGTGNPDAAGVDEGARAPPNLGGVLDTLRGPIKAGIAALFAVGLLLLLLNPPSLSGAEGMAVFIGGGLVLALLTAWAFVALTGSDAMPDDEFERLVRRSEELARQPDLRSETSEFDLLVAEAIDRLPPEFQRLLDQTPVVISHRGRENRAYGHYYGDTVARDDYPDRIILYQDTLERDFGYEPDILRAEVERTLRHELAHHLGWREQGVRDLGL